MRNLEYRKIKHVSISNSLFMMMECEILESVVSRKKCKIEGCEDHIYGHIEYFDSFNEIFMCEHHFKVNMLQFACNGVAELEPARRVFGERLDSGEFVLLGRHFHK